MRRYHYEPTGSSESTSARLLGRLQLRQTPQHEPSEITRQCHYQNRFGAYTISLAPFALRVTSRKRYSPFDGPAEMGA